MTTYLKTKPGMNGANTLSIPATWDAKWFRNFISNTLQGGDVRNATGTNGITVSGNIASPYATISGAGLINTVSGTTNQIDVSTTSGVATVSLDPQIVLSGATGGPQGAGTINAAGLYVNGVAVTTGGVTSVAGTANEIAVSTSAGVATVSFAQNVIVPAPSSGVALTVTGLTNGNALLVQSAGTSSIQQYINNQTAGGQAILGFQIAGTVNGYVGSAGTAGQLVVDSAAGDLVLRTQGGNFRVTTNSGTSTALEVNANGALSMGGNNATATFGDITASRSASTGVLYLGTNGSHYLYFDGTSYQFGGGAPVTTNGGLITAGGITVTTNTWNVDSGGQKRFYWGSTGDSYFEIGGGSFHWRNSSDADMMNLDNTGGLYMAGATGGDKGAGTINATGLYVNGVAVGGGVTQTTGTFTGTLTGCTSSPTATFSYVIVGNMVFVCNQTALTGTSNIATCSVTGMPAALEPARTLIGVIATENAGTIANTLGCFSVTNGSTTITLGAAAGTLAGFATTGTKGLPQGTLMSWMLN